MITLYIIFGWFLIIRCEGQLDDRNHLNNLFALTLPFQIIYRFQNMTT